MKRINEEQWFKQQQPLLLWMANTDYGRDLLCIDKTFPRITAFAKNYIHTPGMTEFRMGSKWGNVIRYRWKEFQEYAQEYYRASWRLPVLFPVAPQLGYAYTTSTFYPDPDPESATVDGMAFQLYGAGSGVAWATIIAAGGTNADDSSASETIMQIREDTASNTWRVLLRSIFLFDTSAIPDTDTISSATFSIVGTAKTDAGTPITPNIDVYTSAPASNTAIVAGDFDSLGSISQTGSPITYAGFSTSGYNDFAFNATGIGNISKTGVSKFGLRNANYDVAAIAPAWSAGGTDHMFNGKFAETADTTEDPKFVAVHATPSLSNGIFLTTD